MLINSINSTNSTSSTNFSAGKFVIRGKENKEIPYLYNQVTDLLKDSGVPAVFNLGEDTIVLTPSGEKANNYIQKGLAKLGINVAKDAK